MLTLEQIQEMGMRLDGVGDFFRFARLRETVRIKKEAGKPKPWTDDPVLRSAYFCNIFREDDRTTRWFRENVRGPMSDDYRVLLATLIFRAFNYIPTGELIKDALHDIPDHTTFAASAEYVREMLEEALRPVQQRGEKLVTGAYMVRSPHGVDKLTGLLDVIERACPVLDEIVMRCASDAGITTLQELHKSLLNVYILGPFTAYEIVTDLRFTVVGENCTDIMTWASAGPGCRRGLGWVFCNDKEGITYGYTTTKGQELMLGLMQYLLQLSQSPTHWPADWTSWEMREVEHTLCEYDKYRRGQTGQRLKRKYQGV